ncbi:MAG: hypothetical protein CVU97_02235 [Firmicutes bacterium HGW-Firmicutes-21]|nr:MAG: hypothetical protein CVU97_02235 [Firmicutes bacterium HGW-Firmicutes-21]
MKIGLFADSHYCKVDIKCTNRRPSLSYDKIQAAMSCFKEQQAELIICLGDLVDKDINEIEDKRNLTEIGELIKSYGIRCVCCMGNHDAHMFDKGSFENLSGLKVAPLTIVADNKRLILLDANYRNDGTAYNRKNTDWTDSNIPPEQLEWLKYVLSTCKEEKIYIFVHQNLDPAVEQNHIIKNAAEIRRTLADDGRIVAVYQGHYHPGADNTNNGIRYITLRAMCEGTENNNSLINI